MRIKLLKITESYVYKLPLYLKADKQPGCDFRNIFKVGEGNKKTTVKACNIC